MSFIILLLIIVMLYASLTKYGSIYKILFMITVITSMTTAFFIYGIMVFDKSDLFEILNTGMNMTTFIYVCIIWFAADIIVIFKIIKNYRKYLDVNSITVSTPGQERE